MASSQNPDNITRSQEQAPIVLPPIVYPTTRIVVPPIQYPMIASSVGSPSQYGAFIDGIIGYYFNIFTEMKFHDDEIDETIRVSQMDDKPFSQIPEQSHCFMTPEGVKLETRYRFDVKNNSKMVETTRVEFFWGDHNYTMVSTNKPGHQYWLFTKDVLTGKSFTVQHVYTPEGQHVDFRLHDLFTKSTSRLTIGADGRASS
jgi:hypothetical protein